MSTNERLRDDAMGQGTIAQQKAENVDALDITRMRMVDNLAIGEYYLSSNAGEVECKTETQSGDEQVTKSTVTTSSGINTLSKPIQAQSTGVSCGRIKKMTSETVNQKKPVLFSLATAPRRTASSGVNLLSKPVQTQSTGVPCGRIEKMTSEPINQKKSVLFSLATAPRRNFAQREVVIKKEPNEHAQAHLTRIPSGKTGKIKTTKVKVIFISPKNSLLSESRRNFARSEVVIKKEPCEPVLAHSTIVPCVRMGKTTSEARDTISVNQQQNLSNSSSAEPQRNFAQREVVIKTEPLEPLNSYSIQEGDCLSFSGKEMTTPQNKAVLMVHPGTSGGVKIPEIPQTIDARRKEEEEEGKKKDQDQGKQTEQVDDDTNKEPEKEELGDDEEQEEKYLIVDVEEEVKDEIEVVRDNEQKIDKEGKENVNVEDKRKQEEELGDGEEQEEKYMIAVVKEEVTDEIEVRDNEEVEIVKEVADNNKEEEDGEVMNEGTPKGKFGSEEQEETFKIASAEEEVKDNNKEVRENEEEIKDKVTNDKEEDEVDEVDDEGEQEEGVEDSEDKKDENEEDGEKDDLKDDLYYYLYRKIRTQRRWQMMKVGEQEGVIVEDEGEPKDGLEDEEEDEDEDDDELEKEVNSDIGCYFYMKIGEQRSWQTMKVADEKKEKDVEIVEISDDEEEEEEEDIVEVSSDEDEDVGDEKEEDEGKQGEEEEDKEEEEECIDDPDDPDYEPDEEDEEEEEEEEFIDDPDDLAQRNMRKPQTNLSWEDKKRRWVTRILSLGKKFKCKLCIECYSSVRDFKEHMKEQHKDVVERFTNALDPLLKDLQGRQLTYNERKKKCVTEQEVVHCEKGNTHFDETGKQKVTQCEKQSTTVDETGKRSSRMLVKRKVFSDEEWAVIPLKKKDQKQTKEGEGVVKEDVKHKEADDKSECKEADVHVATTDLRVETNDNDCIKQQNINNSSEEAQGSCHLEENSVERMVDGYINTTLEEEKCIDSKHLPTLEQNDRKAIDVKCDEVTNISRNDMMKVVQGKAENLGDDVESDVNAMSVDEFNTLDSTNVSNKDQSDVTANVDDDLTSVNKTNTVMGDAKTESLNRVSGDITISEDLFDTGDSDFVSGIDETTPSALIDDVKLMSTQLPESSNVCCSESDAVTVLDSEDVKGTKQDFGQIAGDEIEKDEDDGERASVMVNERKISSEQLKCKSKPANCPEMDHEIIYEMQDWCDLLLFCQLCNEYINCYSLENHKLKHKRRGDRNLVCNVCKKRYMYTRNLEAHMKLCHQGGNGTEDSFVCHYCGKVYPRMCYLRRHIYSTHENQQRHVCKFCGKVLTCARALSRHEKAHCSVKPYICSECGRGFSQLNNMKGHMRQHTNSKPYVCDLCDKAFTHNVSLKTHKKRYHGIDMWSVKSTATGRPKTKQQTKDDK